ncbi:MAG: hypothetical protein EAX89_13480 [Candidatus Lokiarchaeota archaeon]|nr:hypothetical protein [Candidatus Lokiarchaeota archaeon]
MAHSLEFTKIKQFFSEIYDILKDSNPDVIELWHEISEIKYFTHFTKYEIRDFLNLFDFVSIQKGNYIEYIVINKILFITECFKYLSYDIKNLAEILDYWGFESLVEEILIKNNYKTIKNFRFSDKSNFKLETSQKRYEIDVVGIYQNYILLIDAKQWRRKDSYHAISKAANLQFRRTFALKNNPETFSNLIQQLLTLKVNIKKRLPFILIPIMVTLELNWIRINENSIPLVSIQNLNAFLQELTSNLKFFKTVSINRVFLQKHLI